MDKEVAEKYPDIYEYITSEESAFRNNRVPLATNWRNWSMFDHVDRSFSLKNSQFYLGAQDYTRPFNNIILPIANVNYRTEGFDVKDIELYVDSKDYFHLSLLGRKYHNKWAIEHSIDTVIDESVESYFDYGLALLKNVNDRKPEVVQLQQIAFCDQTDILSGPICLKHYYSISELLDMKGKWNDAEIDNTILMARFSKEVDQANGAVTETPSKYVAVYELEGVVSESWLGKEKLGEDWEDTGKYKLQTQIITYYTSPTDGTKKGITLFKGKRAKTIFKALKRDPIHGRACGRGGIEELFHAQIWTNYSELHIQQMLEAVSKVILTTTDKKLKNQKLTNMKHGQIIDVAEGARLEQLIIQPINKTAFDNLVNKWEQTARTTGAASDPALGLNPVSGTPLGTTQIVTQQGLGIHEYRRGKIATFWGEIYRDWVLKYLKDDMNKGDEWLDELTLSELQEVAEMVSTKESNKKIKNLVLASKTLTKEEQDLMTEVIKTEFSKGGQKKFMKIMKGEFEKLPLNLKFNVAGKQKDLAENVQKLNSIFRVLFTPDGVAMIQSNNGLAELLNDILEQSNLSPVNFASITKPPQQIEGAVKSPIQAQSTPQNV